MTLQSQITKKDYSKLMTSLLLKTPYMIFIVIMGLALIIFHFQNPELGFYYLFLGLGFIGVPVLMYLTVGQAYDKNKHFNETVDFLFTDNGLELVGQTFRSSFTWDQITKVKESNQFFMIFQGRVLLALINKENKQRDTLQQLSAFLKDKKKL